MKVCVLSDWFPPNTLGGAGQVAGSVASRVQGRGHDVLAITASEGDEPRKYDFDGITVRAIDTNDSDRLRAYRGLYNPTIVPAVGRVIDSFQPDVVHAHNVHQYLSYHSLKRVNDLGIPVVLTFHDCMSFEYGKFTRFIDRIQPGHGQNISKEMYKVNPMRQFSENRFRYFPLRNILNRFYLNRYVGVGVAVSQELQKALNANGVDADKVVHNGVDLTKFSKGGGGHFRQRHSLGEIPFVLFGGRLSHYKGSEALVKALEPVFSAIPEAKLAIASRESPEIERMRELSSHPSNIEHLGWLSSEEMAAAYDAATVVATPSLCFDSLPTMNIEALAAGTPVVTSCFGGGKEIVDHGESGFVVDPRDTSQLGDVLYELLSNPEEAEQLGSYGRECVKDDFSLDSQVDEYLQIYRSLC